MASVSSRVSALCAKIQGLAKPGTDITLRRVSMACVLVALHDLGNAARPSSRSTRTTRTPVDVSKFFFVDRLGQGHRGCVAKVRHCTTGKTFALKTHFEGEEEEEMAIVNFRLLQEACFMATCRGHPSLVRLHAVCEHRETGWYYLAMEHAVPSLFKVLRQRGPDKPFPEHEVRRMMRQILSGAKAMHDRGIVHRNINSENVLMAAGGHIVKIGGFGQAACTSETDATDARAGIFAVWYIAPEMLLSGRDAYESELVDSWSIGCLMAELLTGGVLFGFGVNNPENMVKVHLRRIFDVLGVSGKRAMQDMKPEDLELAEQVWKWRANQQGVGKLRSDHGLRKLVPPEVLSVDGFNVLRGLLK